MINYVIRYGVDVKALKIVCIESAKPCGPRSNIDLTQYIWSTFEYYCANNAMLVLPLHTSSGKIVKVHHYRAEIGGGSSRHCGQCVGITKNHHMYYGFSCKNLKIVLRILL